MVNAIMKSSRCRTSPEPTATVVVPDFEVLLAQTRALTPAWQRRLSRAQVQALDPETHLSVLITGQAQPLAPLSYRADFGRDPASFCLRADPVRLVPDLAAVWMHPGQMALDSPLAAAVSQVLAESGLRFELASPERGYVLCGQPPQCQFTTPWAARGESLDAIMPEGPESGLWRRLLSDIQVLAHQHQSGEQAVGGLWFHSGGLPITSHPLPTVRTLSAVQADTALVARALGVPEVTLKTNEVGVDAADSEGAQAEWLEWVPASGDSQEAMQALEALLTPLWRRLRWRGLRRLTLASPRRAWHWRTSDVWRLRGRRGVL